VLRRYAFPFDKSEISLNDIVKILLSLDEKPQYISETTWHLLRGDTLSNAAIMDFLHDSIIEDLDNLGGPAVLTLGWDGEGLGHSGIKTVSRWGSFYIFDSSDHHPHGPFRTADEALELEYFYVEGVPGGSLWFDPEHVKQETVFRIGRAMCGEDGGTVTINDVV
jgi:hypothetical protein